jgi:ArsR family transcriptional regulator, arsenate/arsenite/antimonite-responsive transcriptional repressor
VQAKVSSTVTRSAVHFDQSRNNRLTRRRHQFISMIVEKRSMMDSTAAISALGALAQEHRLALFRLLVQAVEDGMAAGVIAEALGVPNSSLSFHLAQLHGAGLIRQERRHRSLIYRADYAAMNALVGYLMENCCAGSGCAPEAARAAESPSLQERKSA